MFKTVFKYIYNSFHFFMSKWLSVEIKKKFNDFSKLFWGISEEGLVIS